jgi:predicted O-linked N-acetylglucosamine transferase (SPINDLY family)
VGASLLNAVGLKELITKTEKEYENLIIKIATNPKILKNIKKRLEKNRLTKPLFNTKLYTKNIESAYKKIYKSHCTNLKPENIYIK